jgi:EmrB/QacA subfamily drug resistance transporter
MVSPAAPAAAARPRLAWLALGAVLTGTLTGTLGNSMANVALPSMMSTFNIAVGDALWFVTIYILMYSVPMPVFGRLGDLRGYKRIYIVSLSLFALFSLLAGLAPNYPLLIVFRALQGLANAPTLPAVMGIIALLFPPEQRGQAMGVWAFANSASHAVGPPLSGFIVQFWGWPGIFLILVPLSLAGVGLIARYVPDDRKHGSGGFDYAGAAAFMFAMLGLMVALTQGPKIGWASLIVILAGAGFACFMALLAIIEPKSNAPFIDARLFKNRSYSAAAGVISIQVLLQFGLALALPLFLTSIQKQSSALIGLVVFALPMTMAVVAPFAGRFADLYGNRRVSFIGMVLVALSALAFFTLDATTPALALMAMLVGVGIGMGLVQSPTASAVSQVAPREKLGVAMGLFNMIRFMGGLLGTTLFGILLDIASPQLGLLAAFQMDFGVVVLFGGAAAALTLWLPGKRLQGKFN